MIMDFKSMEKDQIEDMIIDGKDMQVLYRLDVYLERKISTSFFNLNKEQNPLKKGAIKNTLSWAQNLHDICKKRQQDLREDNNAFNARFRIEAQRVLPGEVYIQIAEAAKR
jgi:hypothetical protein